MALSSFRPTVSLSWNNWFGLAKSDTPPLIDAKFGHAGKQ
jgi:hypothetical protein